MFAAFKIYICEIFLTFILIKAENLLHEANILIFGGNGFLGSECSSQLLSAGHKLTLINRGSDYFDYNTRVKPFVTQFICDRYQGTDNCTELHEEPVKYDFIIDFSAYHPIILEDTILSLKGRFQVYIYISTDSVYEVCQPSGNRKSKESDAVRFLDENLQNEANDKDMYGHLKLAGEEILRKYHKEFHFSYFVLRLPDVIGPRDNTHRWWAYQTWFQFHPSRQPLLLPKSVQSTFSSCVYVKDVAFLITKIVEKLTNGKNYFLNDVFNLGFEEEFSLRKVLNSMQQFLGIQGVEYRYSDEAYQGFPSVFRGPVDVSKAKEVLRWKTTPWVDVLNETITFYKQALFKFPRDRTKMLDTLRALSGECFQEIVEKIEDELSKSMELKESHHHMEL